MNVLHAYIAHWNEAHRLGLEFYENLPDDARSALHQRLHQLHKDKKAAAIIENYAYKGELKTLILKELIDFVPVEQALRLLRCEIWARFAKKRPEAVTLDELWIDIEYFLRYISQLKEGEPFRSEWYALEQYTPTCIEAVFRVEIYAMRQLLAHCLAGLERDTGVLLPAVRRIYDSIEHATYKIDFLHVEIELRRGKGGDFIRDMDVSMAKGFINLELSRPCLFDIQEDNPFAAAVGEYLAQISLTLAHEKKAKQPQIAQNEKHLKEIIDNFRQNNFSGLLSETKAAFEMQNGAFELVFSTKRLLYKGYLLKPMGYALLATSLILCVTVGLYIPVFLILFVPGIFVALHLIT